MDMNSTPTRISLRAHIKRLQTLDRTPDQFQVPLLHYAAEEEYPRFARARYSISPVREAGT
jgi:hypothetical protein